MEKKKNFSSSNRLLWIGLFIVRDSAGIAHTVTAQARGSQVKAIQSAILMRTTGRSWVVFTVGVNLCVNGLVAGRHRLRENGVHVAFWRTWREHSRPVEFVVGRLLSGHHGTLRIVHHGRFSLFNGMTVNIIQLASRSFRTRVDKVRALLVSSHPGRSLICRGRAKRVTDGTIVQPVDRGHRISQRLLLRETRTTSRRQSVAIHGRVAKSRTRNTIGRRNGVTDFFLNGLRGIGRRLGPFQVGLRMREMARSCGVTSAEGTLLEVSFQDIASRERVFAEHAHVRAITGVFIIRQTRQSSSS